MHPDMARELANQRDREMRTRAREVRLARRIRKEQHARRDNAETSGMLIMPRIPDYVDGSFRDTERAA